MKIFLDTHDLINLLEGHGPCTFDELRNCFQNGGHTLVLNMTAVFEIAAPLSVPSSKTVVTRLLNDLERLPHVFINDAQIQPKEVESAIQSYAAGQEYASIDPPYVDRFDKAIPISGPPHTALYINHGLAETVFAIWQVDRNAFRWPMEQVTKLLSGIALDRSMLNTPTVAQHFREKLRRDLKLYNIPYPQGGVDVFADWIYEIPTRCPTVRIGYEVYHQIRRNVGDQPSASDFGDFAHIQCLPYVDLMTLDRRMADYVRRATQGWKDDPSGKVRHDLDSIMREL